MRSDLPKPLDPIAGRPMIDHLMESCRAMPPYRRRGRPRNGSCDRPVQPHAVVVQGERAGSGDAVLDTESVLAGFGARFWWSAPIRR